MYTANSPNAAASAKPTDVTTSRTPSVDRMRRPQVTGGTGSNE